jgi:hypothetical protein
VPLSISYWLDKTNEVKSGEGEKLIQRFLQFSFPLRNQLLLPYPKIIGGQEFNPADFPSPIDFGSKVPHAKREASCGLALWPCGRL